jgi:hypothetical protein
MRSLEIQDGRVPENPSIFNNTAPTVLGEQISQERSSPFWKNSHYLLIIVVVGDHMHGTFLPTRSS